MINYTNMNLTANFFPQILNKWGEYSNDVQFVLQRTTAPSSLDQSPSKFASSPTTTVLSPKDGSEPSRNLKKSLTISGGTGYQNHRIGVVQGVPQRQQPPPQPSPDSSSSDLKSASQAQVRINNQLAMLF
jgi:hypothetical protein